MIQHYADYFSKQHAWAMPVVAETYDGVLNDINAQHVTGEHAMEAIRTAQSGFVQEGSSGGGNGMICYEFKGGTGTTSRQVNIGSDGNGQQHAYTMGALVQANHGIRPWLNILGKPVGQILNENRLLEKEGETGSIIVILATDAPMSGLQLRQLAKRAAIGVGRGGSPGGNSSGDIFLAFSVANPRPIVSSKPIITESFETINNNYIDPLYLAAVECVEEAVVNAIVAGQDVPTFKPQGRVCSAIDTQRLASIFQDSS
jgi:L-aminopeptidase/D-esterase-like protein